MKISVLIKSLHSTPTLGLGNQALENLERHAYPQDRVFMS